MRTIKITTMRGFAESQAKSFIVHQEKVSRKRLEELTYKQLNFLVTHGKVEAVYK